MPHQIKKKKRIATRYTCDISIGNNVKEIIFYFFGKCYLWDDPGKSAISGGYVADKSLDVFNIYDQN